MHDPKGTYRKTSVNESNAYASGITDCATLVDHVFGVFWEPIKPEFCDTIDFIIDDFGSACILVVLPIEDGQLWRVKLNQGFHPVNDAVL
jgi:hypothetical protein